jgi:hypothetical protein
LTNESEYSDDEPVDVLKAYDDLIYEIYATFYQHAKEATAFEAGNTLDDKWTAYNESRRDK